MDDYSIHFDIENQILELDNAHSLFCCDNALRFLVEIDEYYADVRYERIAILNALGVYYTYLGKIETKQREKEEHFILATQYYNKASRIDMHEPSTWVGKGESSWHLSHLDIAEILNLLAILSF